MATLNKSQSKQFLKSFLRIVQLLFENKSFHAKQAGQDFSLVCN